jgi:hypothetical protein
MRSIVVSTLIALQPGDRGKKFIGILRLPPAPTKAASPTSISRSAGNVPVENQPLSVDAAKRFHSNALSRVKPHGVFVLATGAWIGGIPGARVTSVPFMYDSAPHFQLPHARLENAKAWVRSL